MAEEKPKKDKKPPIRHVAQSNQSLDELQRSGVVKGLVAIIKRLGADSAVIALEGKWGDGKTSVLHFVKTHFSDDEAEFFDLEVWHWSRQGSMTDVLTKNLTLHLLGQYKSEDTSPSRRRQLAKTLLAMSNASSTDEAKALSKKALEGAGTLFAAAFGSLAAVATWVINMMPQWWLATLASALGLTYLGIRLTPWATRSLAATVDSPEEGTPSLPALLNKHKAAGKKLICVIDDVDRLTGEQLLELCQVLKASLNWPNVHFIIMLDRDATEAVLAKHMSASAAMHYLEKIIQHRVIVPAPDYDLVATTLEREVYSTLAHNRIRKQDYSQNDLDYVFSEIVMEYVRNLRDVHQFRETFQFLLDAASDSDGHSQLYPPDLMVLAALWTFDRAAYEFLHQRFLLEKRVIIGTSPRDEELKVATCLEAFTRHDSHSATRRTVFQFLFQKTTHDRLFSEEPEEFKRLNCGDYAQSYWTLSGEHLISITDIGMFMDPPGSATILIDKLLAYTPAQQNEFRAILEQRRRTGAGLATETLKAALVLACMMSEPDSILSRSKLRRFWSPGAVLLSTLERYFHPARGIQGRYEQLKEVIQVPVPIPARIELLGSPVYADREVPKEVTEATLLIADEIQDWLRNPKNIERYDYLDVYYRFGEYAGMKHLDAVFEEVSDEFFDALISYVFFHIARLPGHGWTNISTTYLKDLRIHLGESRITAWCEANRSKIESTKFGFIARGVLLGHDKLFDRPMTDSELLRLEAENYPEAHPHAAADIAAEEEREFRTSSVSEEDDVTKRQLVEDDLERYIDDP